MQQQTDCPHQQAGLTPWEDASMWPGGQLPPRGSVVTLPPNRKVLLSYCSLQGMAEPYYFKRIEVPESSEVRRPALAAVAGEVVTRANVCARVCVLGAKNIT